MQSLLLQTINKNWPIERTSNALVWQFVARKSSG